MNRRLYRSPDDRILAGVAGGMAEAYDFDPAVVRILWALLILLTGGVFFILYIVMALVVPLRSAEAPYPYHDTTAWAAGPPPPAPGAAGEDTEPTTVAPAGAPIPPGVPPPAPPYMAARPPRPRDGDNTAPLAIGAVLIIIGAIFLVRQFIDFDIGRLWPFAIIVIGLVLIATAMTRSARRR